MKVIMSNDCCFREVVIQLRCITQRGASDKRTLIDVNELDKTDENCVNKN